MRSRVGAMAALVVHIAFFRLLQQRFRSDRKVAHTHARRVVDRVRDRRCDAGCGQLADTLRADRARDRPATRPGGPLRADRTHLVGLRDRPSDPAASPALRDHVARRPRIPRKVADMLDSTVESVNSALKRARAPGTPTGDACRAPLLLPAIRCTAGLIPFRYQTRRKG
jgi:hypothetical protein